MYQGMFLRAFVGGAIAPGLGGTFEDCSDTLHKAVEDLLILRNIAGDMRESAFDIYENHHAGKSTPEQEVQQLLALSQEPLIEYERQLSRVIRNLLRHREDMATWNYITLKAREEAAKGVKAAPGGWGK
jgi:hypothetical protein